MGPFFSEWGGGSGWGFLVFWTVGTGDNIRFWVFFSGFWFLVSGSGSGPNFLPHIPTLVVAFVGLVA